MKMQKVKHKLQLIIFILLECSSFNPVDTTIPIINNSPQFPKDSLIATVYPEQNYAVVINSAWDPDLDSIGYSLVSSEPNLSLSELTLRYSPVEKDTGIHIFQIIANDYKKGYDTLTVVISVRKVTMRGTFSPIDSGNVWEYKKEIAESYFISREENIKIAVDSCKQIADTQISYISLTDSIIKDSYSNTKEVFTNRYIVKKCKSSIVTEKDTLAPYKETEYADFFKYDSLPDTSLTVSKNIPGDVYIAKFTNALTVYHDMCRVHNKTTWYLENIGLVQLGISMKLSCNSSGTYTSTKLVRFNGVEIPEVGL